MSQDLMKPKQAEPAHHDPRYRLGDRVIISLPDNLDEQEQIWANGKRGTIATNPRGLPICDRDIALYTVRVDGSDKNILAWERELAPVPEGEDLVPEKLSVVSLDDVVAALNKDMDCWPRLLRFVRQQDLKAELDRRSRLAVASLNLPTAEAELAKLQAEIAAYRRTLETGGVE